MNDDGIAPLPRVPLNGALGRLGYTGTHAKLLDGPLEFRPMRVFHAGLIADRVTEMMLEDLETGDIHTLYVDKAPRNRVTFFSRWRCIGRTTTGCRFVLWNPTKIERDMKRRRPHTR